ncbi:hypothetical protein Bbelb_030980 [Branchiostoma belcheri]|nr:hypothetical protein Bbelb_030980 [Branchiostoma belcheri]
MPRANPKFQKFSSWCENGIVKDGTPFPLLCLPQTPFSKFYIRSVQSPEVVGPVTTFTFLLRVVALCYITSTPGGPAPPTHTHTCAFRKSRAWVTPSTLDRSTHQAECAARLRQPAHTRVGSHRERRPSYPDLDVALLTGTARCRQGVTYSRGGRPLSPRLALMEGHLSPCPPSVVTCRRPSHVISHHLRAAVMSQFHMCGYQVQLSLICPRMWHKIGGIGQDSNPRPLESGLKTLLLTYYSHYPTNRPKAFFEESSKLLDLSRSGGSGLGDLSCTDGMFLS